MLQISTSENKVVLKSERFQSLRYVNMQKKAGVVWRVLAVVAILIVGAMLLPWTQNIRAYGRVIALRPDQRPQTINSILGGRIEKWYVKEGDKVKKGDTILYISEIKDDYFDTSLLARTDEQMKAKELTVQSYMEKVKAMDNQIDALSSGLRLQKEKANNLLLQAKLAVQSDSIDLVAAEANYQIALAQLERQTELYEKGLKSLSDLEARKLKVQETKAKLYAQENKLLSSRNQVINARIELSSIAADYRDKISKGESEKFSALSSMYDAEATVTKLQNQYANYLFRSGLYFILAPQDGIITKAIRTGLGETIKEGEEIVSIMPLSYDLAVEVYVRPVDLPLVQKEGKIRVQFDGWPAIVFSGWPNISYGTYGGKVIAIDNFISENGMYRVLAVPDKQDHAWPEGIRVGGGVNSMMLLKDVALGYELWRQINGFPPEFYSSLPFSNEQQSNIKNKNEKK